MLKLDLEPVRQVLAPFFVIEWAELGHQYDGRVFYDSARKEPLKYSTLQEAKDAARRLRYAANPTKTRPIQASAWEQFELVEGFMFRPSVGRDGRFPKSS